MNTNRDLSLNTTDLRSTNMGICVVHTSPPHVISPRAQHASLGKPFLVSLKVMSFLIMDCMLISVAAYLKSLLFSVSEGTDHTHTTSDFPRG